MCDETKKTREDRISLGFLGRGLSTPMSVNGGLLEIASGHNRRIRSAMGTSNCSVGDTFFSIRRIMMLEFSQYLENYLWPNYVTGTSSHAHMMSIVVMINEKFRERVPAWQPFKKLPEHFPGFFQQMLEACLSEGSLREQTALLVFLNHCFNSMEVELIRDQVKHLVSLSMWVSLQCGRREQELRSVPKWRKYWKLIQKRDKPELKTKLEWERRFLQRLMIRFMKILESVPEDGEVNNDVVHYCERFLELIIDLEALLPTRRFFNTVLDDCHLVVRCHLASLTQRLEGNLFSQLANALVVLSSTVEDGEIEVRISVR
uniref:RNA helicase aquarius N-terminal domain-containing protein n=1 Tax=Timema poppense TaxID=170557 RepID=A0A7R9HC17_TIMPO|nr:unnamed protein product [Timema poppensis]